MAPDRPPRVAVVGSCNYDLTMTVDRLPTPSQTVLGEGFAEGIGGKGSNQAIAAARLGADASFIGRVGDDRFADAAFEAWDEEGVAAHVTRDASAPTGVAIVLVDDAGENAIAVAPGANGRLDAGAVADHAEVIADADVVLCQLETELGPVVAAAELAAEHDAWFILNPAPARDLPAELYAAVDVLTPNETEARELVNAAADGGTEPAELAHILRERGPDAAVVTLGGDGAVVATDAGITPVAPVAVDVVDTTGAGDAFNAGLAVALAEGTDLVDAVRFANRAGAGACREHEVVPALPAREELP